MKDKILCWAPTAVAGLLLFWFLIVKGLFGALLVTVGLFWVIGLFLRPYAPRLYASKMKTKLSLDEMPVVRPVPIGTQEGDEVMKAFVWLSEPRHFKLEADWHRPLSDKTLKAVVPAPKTDTAYSLVVPGGFDFDGASVPRPFWSLVSPTGILFLPALVHDYAYRHGELLLRKGDGAPEAVAVDRSQADNLFFYLFVETNGMPWLAWVPFLAVRIFGCPFFPSKAAEAPSSDAGSKPADDASANTEGSSS